jgi:hypothetical protein
MNCEWAVFLHPTLHLSQPVGSSFANFQNVLHQFQNKNVRATEPVCQASEGHHNAYATAPGWPRKPVS